MTGNSSTHIGHRAAWLLLGIWVVASALAIWFIFHDPYRDFLGTRQPDFSGDTRSLANAQTTFYHFVDEACTCTRFSLPHILDLAKRYPDVKHVRIQARGSVVPKALNQFSVASPAIAIVNASGKLNYYGPYSSGLVCTEGEDLVARVLASMESDASFQWLNVLGYGCFCDWPEHSATIA